MNLNDQGQIELGKVETELLVWSVPNEVINGFEVNDFEKTIGASKEQMKVIARRLRSVMKNHGVVIDGQQALVLKNALAIVLLELGGEEFQTRTGCDFSDGQQILSDLNDLISKT